MTETANAPPDGDERAARPIPRATYRLQFTKSFGFDDAAALAPYLAKLGISHVYASPYLKARPGSSHGYDIVSHSELNPELGPPESFQRMNAAFRANGLSQILDFVPNHMGVGGADNPWWLDVLEWGPASEFAGWFDIDWRSDRRYLQNKLLIPLLGDQYGIVLQSGALVLKFDAETGSFAVWAYDTHKFPINPFHYAELLGDRHPDLERIGDAFANLSDWQPHVARRAGELKAELAHRAASDAAIAAAIHDALGRINGQPGDYQSWAGLNRLIQRQHWRAAHFRVAADDINYRRFFNINELAGMRMELPELFDQAHTLVFQLLADGVLEGLRIDHIDGLLDPKAYCRRLREKAPRPFYLVVEKILAPHESLPEEWGVEGTTGYEFANLLTDLLTDPAGEEPLMRFYTEFTGSGASFGEIVRECKLRIIENEMAGELNVLARDAARIARSNARTADFTNNVLRRALQEIVACMPVYRTYVDELGARDVDRRYLDWAVTQARRHETALDPSVFGFLHQLLTGDLVAEPRSGFSRSAVIRLAMRVQQYSGPVMAKGLEDTAFYRYNRLLALNEVGGHPEQLRISIAGFHHANLQRAKSTPHAMLSTSTHDTKRGEDARARLAVLSELADEWSQHVRSWSRILRAQESGSADVVPPDRNDEYSFYQTLVGAWPAELSTGAVPDAEPLAAFRERIEGAMLKSMREARLHTNWAAPNAEYEDASLAFVRHALEVSPFLESFAAFQQRAAHFGMLNSLVQTVLKLTVPGVPDIYQGAELWDFNLVDPDNRRPVDFALREARLPDDETLKHPASAVEVERLLENWRTGEIKQWLIARLLRLRRDYPDLFARGSYSVLTVHGSADDRILAYSRSRDDITLVVAASLCPSRAAGGWGDARIEMPDQARASRIDVLEQRAVEPGDTLLAGELFARLPVAVLMCDGRRG